MEPTHRTSYTSRREIDEPGIHANLATDVSTAVSSGGTASSRNDVHVRQDRSVRAGPLSGDEAQPVAAEQGLSPEEINAASAEPLPDREQMSLVNTNVAVPINIAVAANVLSDDAVATADADQVADIDQSN